jgi:hypothetical protein
MADGLKKSLGKVLAGVRAGKDAIGSALERDKPAGSSMMKAIGDVTGRTVYGDRPLRFRSLTITDPDLPSITDVAALEPAFKIRVSHMHAERLPADAQGLVEHRYGGRGYQVPTARRDPQLMTFVAYDEGRIVGTVSVRLDSPQRGLAADDIYAEELAALRSEGRRLCEFTRLAVDTAIASKPVLASLFHTAYMYASFLRGYDYMVIEVNPRHADFYARTLNFHKIGPERTNTRVNAPAVLLGIAFDTVDTRIAQCAGRGAVPEARGSLYRYFFPTGEQAGILRRLERLVETGSDIAVSKERDQRR